MRFMLELISKDCKRNKIITIALSLFLMISALLMAGGLRVTATIISSVRGLNKAAVPPEYLQMHKGDYNEEEMDGFTRSHDYIEDALTVKQLNINNSDVIYNGESFEKCLMDNSFVVQNEEFDYLLDLKNEVAVVHDGEIGIPVYYEEEYGFCVGDEFIVHKGDYSKKLTVATIIRDSTMNVGLAYSKRLLVSQNDLNDISAHMGEWEYIFEYQLKDGVTPAQIAKDYLDAGLPSNGEAITPSLLAMINALSYGLVAAIIIAISILLVLISLLCLSYIIGATLVEENKTIGEMKAIGFPRKTIQKLYQMKYSILMAIAGIFGFFLAIPFGDYASASVIRYCGNGEQSWMKWVFPLAGIVFLSLLVAIRCRRMIQRKLKSTVVELIRGDESAKKEGHYTLVNYLKHRNLAIAFGELKCKWKEYIVICLVFLFSSFLILLPRNMRNTISDPSFISYMGVGKCDIRIHIQYCDGLLEKKDSMVSYLQQDPEIEQYAIYQNGSVLCQNKDGDWEYIKVSNGDESVFPLDYLEGRAPAGKDEIALSTLNSKELGKNIGDPLTINYGGASKELTVCGTYQDVTYSGKTSKAKIDFKEEDVEGYMIFLRVKDGVSIEEKSEELHHLPIECKVAPVSEFVLQTLGGVMDNMQFVESAALTVSLVLILLITAMFLQLLTAREHSAIAVKKAIGFSNKDIRIQMGIRILTIQCLAILLGTILANRLGGTIFSTMLSSYGVEKVTMLIEPLTAYILCPAVQFIVVLVTVIVSTRVICSYHIRDQILE